MVKSGVFNQELLGGVGDDEVSEEEIPKLTELLDIEKSLNLITFRISSSGAYSSS